jgi:hypothetical protein
MWRTGNDTLEAFRTTCLEQEGKITAADADNSDAMIRTGKVSGSI